MKLTDYNKSCKHQSVTGKTAMDTVCNICFYEQGTPDEQDREYARKFHKEMQARGQID